MNNRGVTLVELLVAMSIVAILVIALAFNYQGWMGKYKVETATKTLYTDLVDARSQAVQRAVTYLADFPTTTSYRIANDANDNDTINAGEVMPTFPKTVGYTINGGVLLKFDKKGLIYSGSSPVLIDPANPVTISLTSTLDPDYDCIRMGPTRINTGKMQGTVCNVK